MKKKYFRLCGLLLFFSFSSSGYSQQNSQLHGKVKDNLQKLPLPGTNIRLLRLPDSVQVAAQATNSQGLYSLTGIPHGRYALQASMMGYQTSTMGITVMEESINAPDIILLENYQQLKEVVVLGNIPTLEHKADRLVMNLQQMQTAGETALDVLRKAPGVTLDKDDQLIYRGSGGVIVMIDGRRTYMSGAQLSQNLKQMQAENISKIELIANPPASYDAEGLTGMINIRLKKSSRSGLNGTVNLGTGVGRYEKIWGGSTLNYQVGKFTAYSQLNAGHYNSYNQLNIDRIIGDSLFSQRNYWHPITKTFNYSMGGDYKINNQHLLGVIFKGYTSPVKTNVDARSVTLDRFQTAGPYVTMRNPQKNRSYNYALNVNYTFKLDTLGKELNVDADLVQYQSSRNETFKNDYFNMGGEHLTEVQLRNYTPSEVTIRSVKADYSHPLAKSWKIETGWKSSWVTNDSQVQFDSLKNDAWVSDRRRTDHFIYDENINAGYLSVGGSLHKSLELKAGLRAEQTFSKGHSLSTESQVNRNYWKLFPSLFLSYNVTNDHKLNGSYSRRISRPAYSSVNPFVFYSDPYTAIKGNPFLQPAFSQSFQFNYTFKSFQILSFSYVKERDVSTKVFTQDDNTKESISIPMNLNAATYLSVNSGGTFGLTPWWNTNLQLTGEYSELSSPIMGAEFENSGFSWSANAENYFNLPQKWRFSLSGYYSSPSVNGLHRMKAGYLVSTGVRKILLQDKLTANFNITDIFDTARFRSTIRYNNINARWQNEWESRRFNLSFSYTFGNNKLTTARNRKTGTSEEENRAR